MSRSAEGGRGTNNCDKPLDLLDSEITLELIDLKTILLLNKKSLDFKNLLKCAGFPPFSLRKQAKTWQRLIVLVVNFLSFPS